MGNSILTYNNGYEELDRRKKEKVKCERGEKRTIPGKTEKRKRKRKKMNRRKR